MVGFPNVSDLLQLIGGRELPPAVDVAWIFLDLASMHPIVATIPCRDSQV